MIKRRYFWAIVGGGGGSGAVHDNNNGNESNATQIGKPMLKRAAWKIACAKQQQTTPFIRPFQAGREKVASDPPLQTAQKRTHAKKLVQKTLTTLMELNV